MYSLFNGLKVNTLRCSTAVQCVYYGINVILKGGVSEFTPDKQAMLATCVSNGNALLQGVRVCTFCKVSTVSYKIHRHVLTQEFTHGTYSALV